MVIPDNYPRTNDPAPKPVHPSQLKYTPRPLDRLAAQVFDLLVVLTPLFLVLTAPFKTRLYHGFLVENQDEIVLCSIANVAIAFGLFILYNGIGTWRWGTTVGKHLFYLKVTDVWTGRGLNFWASIGRACVSALSFLTMGLAFLPMLSNDRRRNLADLCFDSEVISERPTVVSTPDRNERWFVRGIFSLTILTVAVGVVLVCHSVFVQSVWDSDISAWLNDRANHCDAVDEAVTQWPALPTGKKENRLRITLALYAAGLVDRTCLQSESESEAVFSTAPTPLYYLAQSFVHSDEPDISDSYLEQVCVQDPKSSSCDLSEIVGAWSNEDWQTLESAFSRLKKPDVVASIWAIRHFMKHGEPERAYSWMEKISPNKPLGAFLAIQRTKALWMMDRYAESRMGALEALESLPEDLQVDLAAWMCVQETNLECQTSASVSCRWLQDNKANISDPDAGYAVALLKTEECAGTGEVDYGELASAFPSTSWKKLVHGAGKVQAGDKTTGMQLLQEVMNNEKTAQEIRAEAYRHYFANANDQALQRLDLDELPKGLWREIHPRLVDELGRRHLDRLPASEKAEP